MTISDKMSMDFRKTTYRPNRPDTRFRSVVDTYRSNRPEDRLRSVVYTYRQKPEAHFRSVTCRIVSIQYLWSWRACWIRTIVFMEWCVLLVIQFLRLVGRLWSRKPVNHASWVSVVTPTDRPKSVRNRCVIEDFAGVFVLSRCFLVHLSRRLKCTIVIMRRLKCTIVIMRCPSSFTFHFFDFFSESAEWNLTKLYRKLDLNIIYQIVFFFGPIGKTRWPPWPLIDWDIFDFSSETAERNSTKLERKQNLNVLYQVCTFWVDRKNKMAVLASDWLRHYGPPSERNSMKF